MSTVMRRAASKRKPLLIRWLVAAGILLALVVAGFVGAKKVLPDPTLDEVTDAAARIEELGGDNPAVILTPKRPTQGIVLYAHGNKQTEREVLSGRNVAPLTADLLDAGYIVVSSLADGNAWGNDASLATYKSLVSYVRSQAPVDDLYIMGESMGGLPSLRLAATLPDVKAWAGFYPVCDARTVLDQEDLRKGIEAAYPGGTGVGAVSPVAMPKVPLMFWHSPDDTRVPKTTNADTCAATARKAGAEVAVVTTTGNHGDPSNFDAGQIIRFFNAH